MINLFENLISLGDDFSSKSTNLGGLLADRVGLTYSCFIGLGN